MYILEILVLTLFFYLIWNFSKVRQRIFVGRDLVFPFSLAFAVTIVDSFIKAAFMFGFFIFLLLFAVCFGILYFLTAPKK
jgi:hypothetical protein